jgi:hypothetical protein
MEFIFISIFHEVIEIVIGCRDISMDYYLSLPYEVRCIVDIHLDRHVYDKCHKSHQDMLIRHVDILVQCTSGSYYSFLFCIFHHRGERCRKGVCCMCQERMKCTTCLGCGWLSLLCCEWWVTLWVLECVWFVFLFKIGGII